jgi:type I restriction enzyme S subunit
MSWELKSLKEVAINLDNKRKPLNENERNLISNKGLYPYIGANNIMGYVDEYLFDNEILCVAEDGGSWGQNEKCASYLNEKCWVNNHAHVLGFNGKAHLKYLMYFLNKEDLNKYITGSTRGKLTKSALESIQIPLPSLPTQKRIAEILDAADALRRKDQELLRKYDELAQAIFIDMFGDPVKNEKGWNRIPFAELFNSRLGKMLDAKKQTGGTKFKYLGNSNLQWFRYNLNNLSEMEFADNEIEKFELKKGDILICEGGEVGRCAIWNNEMPNVYFQKAIHRARAISNNITSEYTVMLFWFLAKFGGLNDYVTAATIAHLTGEKLKLIPIPVPPIELQNKYRDAVLELNKQKELFAKSQLFSENMFDSLLQQAFKGELVK